MESNGETQEKKNQGFETVKKAKQGKGGKSSLREAGWSLGDQNSQNGAPLGQPNNEEKNE